ncbi:hypothetical protein JIN84_05620 [Luteolibacter yonseiensis]|uniref:Uncharacterized protein n=1 Tax=Luteolibacter yonseiensis TaxID=1144680 RepID=A0A934VB62_9BACT|nr:hypothetical protein [Luteolibacter yonseiensis]MBK1815079.1 hypothetical protein [Luteolibacter yonseiensis]
MQLGMAGLAGCRTAVKQSSTVLRAGPFAVTVPVDWSRDAIIAKIPINPLHTPENWKLYQENEQYALKPGYSCRPGHWAIRLPAALPGGVPRSGEDPGDDPTAPQILIHKADEWRLTLTDGKHEESTVAETLRALREKMETAMDHEDPHLSPGYMDASMEFTCLKRRIGFTGGHGIRMVTQWTIEPDLMISGRLHYLFLGMSDDDSCQIIATFPLNLPGLPTEEKRSHLGRSTANYQDFSNTYDQYTSDAKKWLEQNAGNITPSLQTLDQMLESLVVRRWEQS